MLFKKNSYPQECIGWVTFFWRYGDTDPESRSLWLWVHPAFYQQLLDELRDVFSLSTVSAFSNYSLPSIQFKLSNFDGGDFRCFFFHFFTHTFC